MSNLAKYRRIVEQYYEFVDQGDFGSVLSLFSEDCIYERPGYEPMRGKDALASFYENERTIESGEHTLDIVIAEDESAASAGTFDGRLLSGEEVSVQFAEIFRFAGSHIRFRKTFFFRPAV